VVRHACAGDKRAWKGADAERPLDDGGMHQARALVPLLAGSGVRRLMSSPTMRCTQTLGPLSQRVQLAIEDSDRLGPDGSLVPLLEREWASLAGTVMCTHGEVMLPLLDRVRAQHTRIVGAGLEDEWLLAKGSAWHLSFDGDGRIVELRHEAPLPLPQCGAHPDSR
jgi:phosphohistidine phosphatase SixA